MTYNRLTEKSSPYLRQHKDNPVHWYPWGTEALNVAQSENKPVLLSVGYAACHWCHVMAHESFESPVTAALMNHHFINIKVDREEHPDIDLIYQKALQAMGQQGGWPLTMFLTPKGEPFWGGTYFPPEDKFGRMSFNKVLETVADIFLHQQDTILQNREAIQNIIQTEWTPPRSPTSLSLNRLRSLLPQILNSFDTVYGGLKGVPKFPQPVLLDMVWSAGCLFKNERLCDQVSFTLEKICLGGIFDHLGGGFARYSTDEKWLVPHFEKMLYDNALVVSLLCKVYKKHQNALFKNAIEQTLSWTLRDMKVKTPHGHGFASALDADSDGGEGKFYTWSKSEIDEILGKDSAFFCESFDVSSRGNWEGQNVLHRITPPHSPLEEQRLNINKAQLLTYRNTRVPPSRDHKILCDWNAMMVSALCEAGALFQRSDWIEEAVSVFSTLRTGLKNNNQLYHCYCEGELTSPAYLDDYAHLLQATLSLHQTTLNPAYLQEAENLVDILKDKFWDPHGGGYFMTQARPLEHLPFRPKPIQDNAVPSGNGLMASLHSQLFHLTGNQDHLDMFESLITTFSSDEANNIFAQAGLSKALIEHGFTTVVKIDAESTQKDINQLKLLIKNSYFRPVSILLVDGLYADITDGSPAKTPFFCAQVCANQQCGLPIFSLQDVLTHLNQN